MRSKRRDGMRTGETRLDALAGEHLHRVAFDEVVPALESDTALEAFADLVDVILEASQRGDRAFPELLVPAPEADPVAAMNDTIGDDAASNDLAASLDRLTHLGVPVDDLLEPRLEHAREHSLDFFDEGVDHAVLADGHPLQLGRTAGVGFGLDVERDDQRLGGDCQVDVVDVDVAQASVNDFGAGLGLIAQLLQRVGDWLDAALHVGFDDQVQLLDGARADAGKDGLEGHLAFTVTLSSGGVGPGPRPREPPLGPPPT